MHCRFGCSSSTSERRACDDARRTGRREDSLCLLSCLLACVLACLLSVHKLCRPTRILFCAPSGTLIHTYMHLLTCSNSTYLYASIDLFKYPNQLVSNSTCIKYLSQLHCWTRCSHLWECALLASSFSWCGLLAPVFSWPLGLCCTHYNSTGFCTCIMIMFFSYSLGLRRTTRELFQASCLLACLHQLGN